MGFGQVLGSTLGGLSLGAAALWGLSREGRVSPAWSFGQPARAEAVEIAGADHEADGAAHPGARGRISAVRDGRSVAAAGAAHPEEPRPASAPVKVASLAPLPDATVDAAQDDDAHPEPFVPSTPIAPSSEHLHPDSYLGALSKETVVYQRPSSKSKILGFARTGALLRRALAPAGREGCKEGWYRVEPEGYVCVGRTATLDIEHPVLRVASYQPDRSLPMPYVYGRSRYPTPPFYTKIPTTTEQERAEQDLRGHLRKNFGAVWASYADTPAPSLLTGGERVPRPFGYPKLELDFMTGRALGNSAFAFIDLFEAEGRRWGLTADLSLLPLDRLTVVEPSDFSGLILQDGDQLPAAFVRSSKEWLYEATPSGAMRAVRQAKYRESFVLTGKTVQAAGGTYRETKAGQYLKDGERVTVLEPRTAFPQWATGRRTWLDISILKQTLVAYEGERPVFATLVSTGRDGLGDPATTHSTVQGVFRVHTKHVTSTMSGRNADDEFDLRDVPYVQYFHEGYALHAAFWHDGFGGPRSHGCINLSPSDARYLFTWTDPPVPQRWHSALSLAGTYVYVHP